MNDNTFECSLQQLRELDNFTTGKPFKQIIVVPMEETHDSGYGCMKFVMTNKGEIVAVVSGWSDVLHLNGIGGYGKYDEKWKQRLETQMTERISWSIDCLPKSGCIRIMCDKELEADDMAASDYCVYTK